VSSFESHAREFIVAALGRVPPADAPDVYVVSLWVNDEDDDPLRPTAMVGFNTEAAARQALRRAHDPDEVRWNFAHWLQNNIGILCGSEEDPAGVSLRDQSIADGTLKLDRYGSASVAFVGVLEEVVRFLHSSGVIVDVFGRRIPVVIHELDYYAKIAEQNRRANPGDLINDFSSWVEGLYEQLGATRIALPLTGVHQTHLARLPCSLRGRQADAAASPDCRPEPLAKSQPGPPRPHGR
jgi:hypothetical protein